MFLLKICAVLSKLQSLFFVSGYAEVPSLKVNDIEKIAQHCNDRKSSAKAVSDASAEMFFSIFVKVSICTLTKVFRK